MDKEAKLIRTRGEGGFLLAEILIAIAIVGTTFTVMIAGLSTSFIQAGVQNERVTAENISWGQRTYTMEQAYQAPPASYATVVPPLDWAVTAEAEAVEGMGSNTEKIVTTVSRSGEVKLVIEDIRNN